MSIVGNGHSPFSPALESVRASVAFCNQGDRVFVAAYPHQFYRQALSWLATIRRFDKHMFNTIMVY
jgi:hypothetical protein